MHNYLKGIFLGLLALGAVAAVLWTVSTAFTSDSASMGSTKPNHRNNEGDKTGRGSDRMRYFKGILVLLIALGTAAAILSTISTALFTDTAQMQNNTFSTGTVDIDLSDSNETLVDNLVTSDITLSGMAPGDQVQPSGGITVKNNGTLDLRYALYASGTDPDTKNLKDELEITIKTIDVTTPATPCDNFDGTTTLYGPTTNFDGAAAAGTFVSLFGDSTAGAQAGDRALVAAASEVLCFRVKLPTTVGNTDQNATTVLTFEFRAEQTKNN